MTKRIIPLLVGIVALTDAQAIDINVTPGSLSGQLGSIPSTETTLRLTGSADARDLALLAKLPSGIRTIDLSGVSVREIAASRPILNGRTWFAADELPEFTFFHSGATEVVLPKGVKSIGEGAFAGSRITSVTIPEGVTSIGDYAFFGCSSLTTVKLPASLAAIGREVFGKCVTLPALDFSATRLTAVPDRSFAGCASLNSVKFPSSVKSLGNEAFSGTAIESLLLQGVTSIGDYALSGMPALREVTLDPTAHIGVGALMDNGRLLHVNSSPEELPAFFAANCPALDTRELVAKTSGLGEYALANSQASDLVLTRGTRLIRKGALANSSALKRIIATDITASIPEAEEGAFEGVDTRSVSLQVNKEAESLWKNHPVWREFDITGNSSTFNSLIDAEGISVHIDGRTLTVSAPEPLTGVSVYTADGSVLLSADPDSSRFSAELDVREGEILLVSVRTAKSHRTLKVIF